MTVFLAILLVIWMMESRGGSERKRQAGARRVPGVQKAKKVLQYLKCLITGMPWIVEGKGGQGDLDVEIIEGVLADPENAHAREVQQHEKVGLLRSCLEQREALPLPVGRASHNKAGG
eukprot:6734291-Prymnesium_polylepis.1